MSTPIGRWLYAAKRWLYQENRPGRLARAWNRLDALQYAAGILSPARAVTLEVRGRRTGRPVTFPVVMAEYEGERYLVSMLGDGTNWVRNVRAAEGSAVIRRHGARRVRLVEVEPGRRGPILRRYLALAPGARPHIPVDRHAPVAAFDQIASAYPVFRIADDLSGGPH